MFTVSSLFEDPLPQADNDTAHTAMKRKLRRFGFIAQSLFSCPGDTRVERKNTQKNRLEQQSVGLARAATLPIRLFSFYLAFARHWTNR